jgi:hypothetical protein
MYLLFRKMRIVWHIVFWAAAFLVLLGIFTESGDITSIDVIYTIIYIIPIILAVYACLYFLVPRFLKKEKLLFFILGIAILSFSSAGLIYMLFDRWIDLILKDYYFINYDSYLRICIFTIGFLVLATFLKVSKEWFFLMRAERTMKESQLKSLRAQVNPHFLLNSLQTVYAQALENSAKTSETILELSDILKFTLYESEKSKVDLSRELDIIRKYIEIQKLRLDPGRAKIITEISGESSDRKIAPMLLLPFLENAFKHGIGGAEKNAYINLKVTLNDSKLEFKIENNAGSQEHIENPEYSGIGIENTRQRLALLYPEKHHLDISKDDKSFKVVLLLELE